VLDGLVNPSVREARQGLALGRLLAGIGIPASASTTVCAPREPPRRGGAHVIPKTSPKTHDDEVLAALAQLKAT
jgi:hypothetical protein